MHTRIKIIQLNKLHFNHGNDTIKENGQIQEIDVFLIDPLVLDNLLFHVIKSEFFVSDIFIVIEKLVQNEFHHIQDTLMYKNNEEILDDFTILLS